MARTNRVASRVRRLYGYSRSKPSPCPPQRRRRGPGGGSSDTPSGSACQVGMLGAKWHVWGLGSALPVPNPDSCTRCAPRPLALPHGPCQGPGESPKPSSGTGCRCPSRGPRSPGGTPGRRLRVANRRRFEWLTKEFAQHNAEDLGAVGV